MNAISYKILLNKKLNEISAKICKVHGSPTKIEANFSYMPKIALHPCCNCISHRHSHQPAGMYCICAPCVQRLGWSEECCRLRKLELTQLNFLKNDEVPFMQICFIIHFYIGV
jgi:hypothetical protein